MFSSSRLKQAASAGGRATRKLAEISRASKVIAMEGKVLLRKEGTLLGVFDEPISRCVVPKGRHRVSQAFPLLSK